MRYLGPNAYHQIVDPETGAIKWQLDPTSKAIEYTDKDLKTLLDKKAVPKELGEFKLNEIKRIKERHEEMKKFYENNPNPSTEELVEWFKTQKLPSLEEVKKGTAFFDFLLENHEKLKLILEAPEKSDAFAIPSHSLMFSLLAMFAGKPERIPRELLEKPFHERTPEEKERAEKYLSEIFETKREVDYSEGKENVIEKRIALICDNAKVESHADITWSLFRHDLSFREERLAIYIKRIFKAEGIRHLLALIIGLEENFRIGHFEWSVNEHLGRLGYRKKSYGSFDPELKRMASEIIRIFTGLCITSTRKDGKKESIKANFLFRVDGFEIQTFEKEIIDEKITLAATDFWYKNAVSPNDGQAPQYTKLLKEIVKENHREHPLTLYLTPLLAIFWRINPERKLSVKTLMEWCDLDVKGKHKSDHLKDLESALEYMKGKNYLGEWSNDGDARFPSQCADPYECVLTLTPPEWLKQEFVKIENKKDSFALPQKQKMVTYSEFLKVVEESGLSRPQLANCLGVTPQLITAIINGKRKITAKTSSKIRVFISQRLETDRNKTQPS
jgi:hypothetical protein